MSIFTNGLPPQFQNSILLRPDGTQVFIPQTQTIQAQAQSPQTQQNQQQSNQAQAQQPQLQQATQQQAQTQPQVQQQQQANTVQQTIVSVQFSHLNFTKLFNSLTHSLTSFLKFSDSTRKYVGYPNQAAIGTRNHRCQTANTESYTNTFATECKSNDPSQSGQFGVYTNIGQSKSIACWTKECKITNKTATGSTGRSKFENGCWQSNEIDDQRTDHTTNSNIGWHKNGRYNE